ncbi:D-malate degradation protein R [Serratia liquefaciens]|jgi:DNA-binding transcriptional LysR family regulator|uniref:LysR family transcriptional regulator n=1 Tax=Serratia TaxID=613 RepID=UPI0003585238|nr:MULTISPECIES: LysR family transcriptional regulator [Serratia]AGQ29245.1 LysR family transcriptional regulator [Serratia liquefaciens ATCC 27592]AKE12296.1 LysR family transcriptional regulator [Serratia liquefaciens]AMG99492.1 LysR family transcriptional regulator [Serratia liquefaciens]AYO36040.1 LysR family transcriptional regulator [Serratia sp. P2ACOL2]MCE9941063.1 LysR family transcriptional regulator [Serratia liquefaciens]
MSLPFDVHRLLPAFLAAAQAQNFSAAARQLGVTPAAISKNIRVLEEKLALRLFQRNTHNVVLTDEGKALLQQVAPLWQALSATLETAGSAQQAPSGTVRVSMIPGFGRQILMPLIPQFLERYPQIDLDLSLDARVVNLVGEGFDVGIGSRVDPDSRLVARPLYPMQMVLAASPGYLAQHGTPQDPDDLLQHNCLLHRNPATGRSVKWPLHRHGEAKTLELHGRLVASRPEMLLDAALAGLGIVCLARWYAEHHFAQGTLLPVLAECWPQPTQLWLYYASADLPPRVRVWVEFLLEHFHSRPA